MIIFNALPPVVCLWRVCLQSSLPLFTWARYCSEWLFNFLQVQYGYLCLSAQAGSWLWICYSYMCNLRARVCVCLCSPAYLCALIKVCPSGCSFSYWLTDLECVWVCRCSGEGILTWNVYVCLYEPNSICLLRKANNVELWNDSEG